MAISTAASLASLALALATADAQPAGDVAATQPAPERAPPSAPLADAAPVATDVVAAGQVYLPADFSRYAPRTALDMVRRVPGFTITVGTNGGSRGLGAATENLLVNGERVAGKSTDAQTVLSRTPASAVTRIEIVDGASLSVPGLTGQVANVFITGGRMSTTIRWIPEWRPGLEDNWFRGDISVTAPVGGSTLTLAIANDPNRNGHWGPETVRNAAGTILFVRDEKATYYGERPRVSAALARVAANGNKLNLNIAGELYDFRRVTRSTSVQPGIGPVRELSTGAEDEWNAEIGGDYEFALAGGRLKLIGLQRLEHSPTVSRFFIARSGGIVGDQFAQVADEGESILRGEYGWKSGAADWQVALEGAYNFLNVDAELSQRQPDGRFTPVRFGGEETRVREKRADLIVTYGRPITDTLTLQANLGAEYSELSSSGPAGLTRRYVRPKGKVALVWKATPRLTVNYEIQRRVDQLNFFDFASSVDLVNNQGNSGNALLVPPQVWRTQLEIVRDFGAYGHLSLAGAYARPKGLIDQVPLSPTTEGRGNVDDAHLYRISGKGSLLLDPLGWTGARIDVDATLRRNRIRDPLTGAWRNVSYTQRYIYQVSLRHDIAGTPLAWGASAFRERHEVGTRLDLIEYERVTRPFVEAFVEHKAVAGFTVRATLRNIVNQRDAYDRTVYVTRRDGPVAFSEGWRRSFGRFVGLSVTGTI